MEWTVFFDNREQRGYTKYCWGCMRMPTKNPLLPIYNGTSSMTIRSIDLGQDYDLIHLYRYWKQRVDESNTIKVEFSYQFNRNILQKMWPSGLLSDIVLIVEAKEFKVHRAVLGISSPYFTTLFTKMKESRDVCIEIKEVQSEPFKELLRLIYGYRVVFKGLDGARLLSLIKRFQIEVISDDDIESLIKSITINESEFFEYIDIISEIYGGEYPGWFINHCFDYIAVDYVKVFLQLPKSFQESFIETYGPLEEL